jgi:hypothetical protein
MSYLLRSIETSAMPMGLYETHAGVYGLIYMRGGWLWAYDIYGVLWRISRYVMCFLMEHVGNEENKDLPATPSCSMSEAGTCV